MRFTKIAEIKRWSRTLTNTIHFAACCLMLFLFCAAGTQAKQPSRPFLLAKLPFNEGAGVGDNLFVVLRTENGQKLLFGVDTGAPLTTIDKSLEPMLGRPIASTYLRNPYFQAQSELVSGYWAPKLFFGGVPLSIGKAFSNAPTGGIVWTQDLLAKFKGRPLMGILGMDCLQNYCVQLDFGAREIRLLDPLAKASSDWGHRVPLNLSQDPQMPNTPLFRGGPGMSGDEHFYLDTGGALDATLTSKPFQKALKQQKLTVTNWTMTPAGGRYREIVLRETTFAGWKYNQVTLRGFESDTNGPRTNTLGLNFLARNLVTVNFPKGVMYLKQMSKGPSVDTNTPPREAQIPWEQAMEGTTANDPEAMAALITEAPNLRPGRALDMSKFRYDSLPVSHFQFSAASGVRVSFTMVPPRQYGLHFSNTNAKWQIDYDTNLIGSVAERGIIVFLHGYYGQKEDMYPWAVYLAQKGYGAVMVDLRGHGESTGQTVSYGKYETEDLEHMLDGVESAGKGTPKVGVLGYGYGGQVALQWAAHDPRVVTAVAIAPYISFEKTITTVATSLKPPAPPETIRRAIDIAARNLGVDWADWSSAAAVRQIHQPMLLIGGGKDDLSLPADLMSLKEAAPTGSKYVNVAGSDRNSLIFRYSELGETIATWFDEHLAARANH